MNESRPIHYTYEWVKTEALLIYLSTYLSIYLCIYLLIYLSTYLYIYLLMYIHVYQHIYVCMCVCGRAARAHSVTLALVPNLSLTGIGNLRLV